MTSLSVAPSVHNLEKHRMYSCKLPQLLLAVAQLQLLGRASVHALKVSDEDPVQVGPVVDLVAGQIFEPRPRGIPEIKQ
jgi:hypothetical protein